MINRIHLDILRALRLHLTQSALSHSIRKLEGQLGTSLWTRRGLHLWLTRAGKAVLELAQRVLPDIEATELQIGKYARGEEGLPRIGMECHPCHEWLNRMLPGFLRQHPGVDLDVKREFQFGGLEALRNHEIDMVLTPDPVFRAGLSFVPVFSYELVRVTAATRPLGERSWVEAQALTEATLFTFPVPHERLDVFTQFLVPARAEPRSHRSLESMYIALHMVAAGRGVTALASWLLAQHREHLDLRSYQPGRCGIHKKLHVGVRDEDLDLPYIKGFVRIAKGVRLA
jgi:LysR family transcriptional regulator for metE and metH